MNTDVTTYSIAEKISTRIIPLTLIGVGFSVLGLAAAWFGPFGRPAPTPPPVKIEQLTSNLAATVKQYWSVAPDSREQLVPALVTVAKQRKNMMAALIQANPRKFLAQSLPQGQTLFLSPAVQQYLELHIERQGRVEIHHTDDFEAGRSIEEYFLVTTDGQRLQLVFTESPPHLTHDSTIAISGVAMDSTVVVDSAIAENLEVLETPTTNALGDKKVLVIFYRSPVASGLVSLDPNYYRGLIFTNPDSVNAYFQEVSFNQVRLVGKLNAEGDVFGPYVVPHTSCSMDAWPQARQKAIDAGVDVSGYDTYVYIGWRTTSCGAALGAAQGNVVKIVEPTVRVIGHEIGHATMSTLHAGRFSVATGSPVYNEYGDPFDIMSWDLPGTPDHMSTSRKSQLGWYQAGEMQTVTSNGTYTIFPVELPTVAPKGLKMYRGVDGDTNEPIYSYLEFRKPFGQWDNFNTYDPVVNGVSIRTDKYSGTQTYLIDTTPGSAGQWTDAAVAVGQSYVGEGFQVTTTAIAPDRSSATVNIILTCARSYPFTDRSPATHFARPGEVKQYLLTITNGDTPACGANTFSVSAVNLPGGWSFSSTPSSVTLNPGQSATVTVSIQSPPTAVFGNTIELLVTNAASPQNHSATQYFQYVIDTIPPSVSLTSPINNTVYPDTSSITIDGTVADNYFIASIEIFIDDQRVQHCTASPCTFVWNLANAAGGVHTIRYKATDDAGNVGSQTVSVEIIVNNTGGGGIDPIETQ